MFDDKERLIFGPYSNGARDGVYADPQAVYRRLVYALGGDPNSVLEQHRSAEPTVKFQATTRLVEASQFAFGLAPFDPNTGGGCLESHCLRILQDYLDWVDKKKDGDVS